MNKKVKEEKTITTYPSYLNLPQKDENGIPYLSYSQKKSWDEKKSFNLGIEGKLEYMLHYFMGVDFPDIGWAEFGQDVEDAILSGDYSKFSAEEVETLKKVEVLEVSQYRVEIKFDSGFYLYGLIDNCNESLSIIKDFKTASLSSSKQYYDKNGYKQLDIYSIGVYEKIGKFPEVIEVDVIERNGNAFKGGRADLKVGKEIWKVKREIPTLDEMKALKNDIEKTAIEIASYKDVFDLINV